jgi:hypothetical protein
MSGGMNGAEALGADAADFKPGILPSRRRTG